VWTILESGAQGRRLPRRVNAGAATTLRRAIRRRHQPPAATIAARMRAASGADRAVHRRW